MNPPTIMTALIGHGIVQVAAFVGFLWSCYAGFTQDVGPILALAFLVLMHFAYRAGEKVRSYKQWKAEWDSLVPRRFR